MAPFSEYETEKELDEARRSKAREQLERVRSAVIAAIDMLDNMDPNYSYFAVREALDPTLTEIQESLSGIE